MEFKDLALDLQKSLGRNQLLVKNKSLAVYANNCVRLTL